MNRKVPGATYASESGIGASLILISQGREPGRILLKITYSEGVASTTKIIGASLYEKRIQRT